MTRLWKAKTNWRAVLDKRNHRAVTSKHMWFLTGYWTRHIFVSFCYTGYYWHNWCNLNMVCRLHNSNTWVLFSWLCNCVWLCKRNSLFLDKNIHKYFRVKWYLAHSLFTNSSEKKTKTMDIHRNKMISKWGKMLMFDLFGWWICGNSLCYLCSFFSVWNHFKVKSKTMY